MTDKMNGKLEPNTIQIATQVIIDSGNARMLAYEALDAAEVGDFEVARKKLEQAKEQIVAAHITQTEVIRSEAGGNPVQITLLLTHAQDSLMVIMTEVQLINRLIKIYERILQDR
jgi:PTS system cellobiose-specific IIA component